MMRSTPDISTRQTGFSLVELLVGIVVAMAAVVVIMQMFRLSENTRRSTTGVDDAQTTGAIALSLLQRDLRQAGEGVLNERLLACQLTLPNGRAIAMLAPAIINPAGIPGGDANTDVLQVVYGSGWSSPEGGLINPQTGPTTYAVPGAQGYQTGDLVVATPQTRAAPCNLTLTPILGTPTVNTVTVATGLSGASNGVLFNLGRTPRFVVYAVRNGRLTLCDYQTQNCTNADAANWTEIAEGIVSLRAEYGRDTSTARDTTLDTLDQDNTTLQTACQWSRVVGIHVALVARGRQPDKTDIVDVSASAPAWSSQASVPISLTGGEWKRYRYKTFETMVPLRNLPAAGDPMVSTCP
ncbi:MAG: hypothetical protein E6Q67_02240 [Roseateles sp.]|nr:MAG: hypothetical protein E6Q67_02240 [Roseateles sp.]